MTTIIITIIIMAITVMAITVMAITTITAITITTITTMAIITTMTIAAGDSCHHNKTLRIVGWRAHEHKMTDGLMCMCWPISIK